jgi:hypothetical protein
MVCCDVLKVTGKVGSRWEGERWFEKWGVLFRYVSTGRGWQYSHMQERKQDI